MLKIQKVPDDFYQESSNSITKLKGYTTDPPTRVFLVEEMPDGKWLYWGNAEVTRNTITHGSTSGKYIITKIYAPEFQRRITIEESPPGKSYFDGNVTSMIRGRP